MTEFNKIEWCCSKKDGIRIVDKNERVGKEYLKSAENDLLEMKTSSLKWRIYKHNILATILFTLFWLKSE
ncbi:hypothetical protein COU57_03220 [Candidatus Pacearchaeota archaeon CG10_big_fil_rev_8_21_14_0_10_32_14]|nr:MAG: hypothetical protein COU57_03220 [Candidatus Pacearchaeota archaeon CG10_big_fil_rev_8_21_14_0_10_32_14]